MARKPPKYLKTPALCLDAQPERSVKIVYGHDFFDPATQTQGAAIDGPDEGLKPLVNAMLKHHGYRRLRSFEDAQWDELRRSDGCKLLLHLLRFGQAYGSERRSLARARSEADDFWRYFSGTARIFGNSDKYRLLDDRGEVLPADRLRGWGGGRGLSDHTFDFGLLVVDAVHIGLYWFFDEH